jgi:hypothetical protein
VDIAAIAGRRCSPERIFKIQMKIINFDASQLNTMQNCFRKAQYSFIYNLSPHEKEESLEKGDLMHKMLEVYYGMRGPKLYTSDVWQELIANGIKPEGDPTQRAIDAGLYFSTKMSVDENNIDKSMDVADEVIKHFRDYAEFYAYDAWNPLHVERSGEKEIYNDGELQINYDCKIDLIAEKGEIVAPFDHKTGKMRKDPLSLSNQFIGYCVALNCNHIVMNKIGFQKTLSPAERFQRFVFNISEERKTEWINNAIWWVKLWSKCTEDDVYPMNLTSCDKYSGCIFRKICESDPSNREYKLARDFATVEKWDVAKGLEREIGEATK